MFVDNRNVAPDAVELLGARTIALSISSSPRVLFHLSRHQTMPRRNQPFILQIIISARPVESVLMECHVANVLCVPQGKPAGMSIVQLLTGPRRVCTFGTMAL